MDDHSDLVERLKFLSDNEVSHKFWSSNEVNHHYFEQLAVPQDHECIYLPDAGSIKASLSVKTMQVMNPSQINMLGVIIVHVTVIV